MRSFTELPSNEQEALLGLTLITGIGPGLAFKLLRAFERPTAIFQASLEALIRIDGIGPSLARHIRAGFDIQRVVHYQRALEHNSIHTLVVGSEKYPKSLLRLSDPPTLLFVSGTIPASWDNNNMLALVGTRHPDRHGVQLTTQTTRTLVEQNWTIVSGGALGIDTAAHRAALAHQGQTIAVVATGVDRAYPAQNRTLFESIRQQGGAILSEFLPGTMPEKGFFPRRNRLISALCCGVVVVQCKAKSGALNTAAHAKRIGVPVFTFPGRPQEELAAGPHRLIREGAHLIESGQELLAYIQQETQASQAQQLSLWSDSTHDLSSTSTNASNDPKDFILKDEEQESRQKEVPPVLTAEKGTLDPVAQNILSTLQTNHPMHIDELAKQVEQPVANVAAHLLQMELEGWVLAHPGMYFTRI